MTTLWAIVERDGEIHMAYRQEALAKGIWDVDIAMGDVSCVELHTYDPDTQVVIDREVYSRAKENIFDRYKNTGQFAEWVKQFLSAGESK